MDPLKAFDIMDRKPLWKIIGTFGFSVKFVGVIKSLHNGLIASVSTACEASDPIGVLTGVKQGCVLAPIFFNLFVSAVFHVLRANSRQGNGIGVR